MVPLQPQPAKVLALLVNRAGQTVSRAELQHEVWGEDTHVDFEQGLNWCIRRIREVLGDTPSDSRYIRTVPRRGYAFLGVIQGEPAPILGPPASAPWWKQKRIAISAIIFVVASVGVGFAVRSGSRHSVTVLVLPFDDVSGAHTAPEYQEIASDQLTAKLSRINPRRLSVIDPMTAKKFKNTKEWIIEIGNRLGADYVLLGEVEPTATAVKVDAQLFKVSTNRQVWAAEQEILRDGKFSTVWDDMSNSIGTQLLETVAIKN
ncbi:MAG TPA: winged helix-turn-helix domain-containing protein [Edaphobacter sp.]|nr:winged helix-turn-helix domain-containing protein [Edaphobacter sp.]